MDVSRDKFIVEPLRKKYLMHILKDIKEITVFHLSILSRVK